MSDFFKNIVRLPPPHTARSFSQLTPVYTADEVAKTVASFEAELAKANNYTAELEVRKEALEESLNGCTEKVLSLSGKLAKANERVKKLEAQTFDVIAAQSIEQAYQIASSFPKDKAILEALSAVKVGATNRLNKFAIEKKAEGVKGFVESFKFLDDAHCVNIIEVRDAASHYIDEQLRKEQDSE